MIVLLMLLAGSTQSVLSEPVTTIRDNGDPANRVDVVVLGDGYHAVEFQKYHEDVEKVINGFFKSEPFNEYKNFFNVHEIFVASNDTGVDHLEVTPKIFKDTAFDSFYGCFNLDRVICLDAEKVDAVLSDSVTLDQRDIVLVLINDTQYGGGAEANIAIVSLDPKVIDFALHEIGHSFGLLADEYTTDKRFCEHNVEPIEPNVTIETDRDLIKWNVGGGPPTGWIELSTPIPSPSPDLFTASFVGLYEGARYCNRNVYRANFSTKMLGLRAPFRQVNEEQLVKRIYNWVSPLDASSPVESALTLTRGLGLTFQVDVPSPLTDSLEVTWSLDGQAEATGFLFVLDSTGLSIGLHTVEVTVRDPTSKVRYDPAQVLTDRRTWTVAVTVEGPGAVPDGGSVGGMPLTIRQEAGGEITVSWGSSSCATTDTDYEIYEGTVDDFASHTPIYCSTEGATEKTFTPPGTSTYYLVVPRNASTEGSYGHRSDGSERPFGISACLPQLLAACP